MSFAALKKNRSASIEKLVQSAQAISGGEKGGSKDESNLWKPTVDKSGNGYAVIRFLPAPEGEDVPWARFWDHGFQGPTGKWYIEKSLTTIGQPDPVSELNSKLWNSGIESDKDQVRKQKRRQHYAANILVISDPSNPDNEGKVFLFQFGKKIFDKIMDVLQPQFQDEQPVNPFDFWEGADFKLKIRNVEGYRNYDKSEFASPAPLFGGDDAKLESVYKQLNSLAQFTDPKNFKSYEELKRKLDMVLGGSSAPMRTAESMMMEDEDEVAPPVVKARSESAPIKKTAAFKPVESDDGDDDDTMSFFSKLAAES
jgi:gp32 DNA binding protein like